MVWAILRMVEDGTTFFEKMLEYDLLKRSSVALEGHVGGGIDHYFKYLWYCKSFVIMAILAAFALPLLLEKEKKDTVCILILSVLIPLILFSFVSTKLNWYILCIFPPLILLAAFGANEIVKNSKKI